MKEYRLADDNNSVTIQRLKDLMDVVPSMLKTFPEEEFSRSPAPGKWSKKEIIGHLIDSAANNHHRFVRAQYEDKPVISYDQEGWNKHGYYASMDGHQVINFWESYNRQLISLMELIPADLKKRECSMGDESYYSIEWLIDDYVRHMEHHLRQISV